MFTLTLMGLALQAAAVPPADDDEIVIRGVLDREVEQTVREVTDALAGDDIQRQLPQYAEPVCPLVIGLEEQPAKAVEDRIRQVAGATKLGAQAPGCDTNMMIVIADDREELFDYWRAHHPTIFTGQQPSDVRRMRDSEDAAVAWQLLEWIDDDGEPLTVTGVGTGQRIRTVESSGARASGRLRPMSRPIAGASVMVVDRAALDGIDVRQLADFAAMRLLSPVSVERAARLTSPTILTIFEQGMDEEVPLSLSEWDFAFLKALYNSGAMLYEGRQRSEIRQQIREELLAAGEGSKD